MEPLVSRTVTGYAEVPPTYVSKPELCMTHTQTLPAMNTAQSSQAFTQTIESRTINTTEAAAGSTQWRTTSNMNNGQMMQGHG